MRPIERASILLSTLLRADTTAVLCEVSTSGVTVRPSSVLLQRPSPEIRQFKFFRMTPSQTYNSGAQRQLTRTTAGGSARTAGSTVRCSDLLDSARGSWPVKRGLGPAR